MDTAKDISKEEFLIDLDQQIKACDADIERIEPEVQRAKARVKGLKDDRLQAIHKAVARLLPDLLPGTIKVIEAQLPGAGITSSLLQREFAEEERSIRGRYRDIEEESRPGLVQRRDLAHSHVRTTEADLASAREALKPLQEILDLERLVEAGYGTPAYSLDRNPFRFFSAQWWSDWQAADKIVEDLKLRDWEAVRLAYEAQANAVSIIERSLRDHNADVDRYQQVIHRIDERDAKIAKIKDGLLERYQTKLRAWIDTCDYSLTGIVPELARIDPELKKLDDEITNLEEVRGRIVGERTQLINLKARLRSSSKRVVPARFASAISRVSRNVARATSTDSGFRAGGGVTHIHVDRTTHYHNDGFIDGMVYQQMMDHFYEPPARSLYGGGSYGSSSSLGGHSGRSSSSSHGTSHRNDSSYGYDGGGYRTNSYDSRGQS